MAERVLVIRSRYYEDIADALWDGATVVLEAAGVGVEAVEVPGALEMPGALAMAVASDESFAGYVILGCVIRGETSHYDVVVNEASRGVTDLVVRHRLALGFGLLTVENRAQALVRARVDRGNKGAEAAGAALSQMALKRRFRA